MSYPPYTIISTALKLVAAISEQLATLSATGALTAENLLPQLHQENRIRTIHASFAIENNTLSPEQVTDTSTASRLSHMGPPAHLVHGNLENLLQWLKITDEHPLITSCAFHYELKFIQKFKKPFFVFFAGSVVFP